MEGLCSIIFICHYIYLGTFTEYPYAGDDESFSSLVFFKKKSTLNELLFIFPTVFSLEKSRKPTTFS